MSAAHILPGVLSSWHEELNNGNSVKVIFTDYARAFGHVHHDNVLAKLSHIGVEAADIKRLHYFLIQGVEINVFSNCHNGGMLQGAS